MHALLWWVVAAGSAHAGELPTTDVWAEIDEIRADGTTVTVCLPYDLLAASRADGIGVDLRIYADKAARLHEGHRRKIARFHDDEERGKVFLERKRVDATAPATSLRVVVTGDNALDTSIPLGLATLFGDGGGALTEDGGPLDGLLDGEVRVDLGEASRWFSALARMEPFDLVRIDSPDGTTTRVSTE